MCGSVQVQKHHFAFLYAMHWKCNLNNYGATNNIVKLSFLLAFQEMKISFSCAYAAQTLE